MTRTHVTCVNCGEEFVRDADYHGNYCQSCHTSWIDEEMHADESDQSSLPPSGSRHSSSKEEDTSEDGRSEDTNYEY
jgi:hypothetical protein